MKYSFENRVRFSEVDEYGKLTLTGLINYFQDCTLFFSEENGMGADVLAAQKRAWFLGSWQIKIREMPSFGEKIIVTTWACGFKLFSGHRNFTLTTPDGRILASALSVWVYVDIDKGTPVIPSEEEIARYGSEAPLEENFGERRIRIRTEGSSREAFQIRRYHLDTNHHVNNGQYIAMAQEYLDPDLKVCGLKAEYKTPAVTGNLVTPVVYQTPNGTAVSLNQENGKPYALVEFLTA